MPRARTKLLWETVSFPEKRQVVNFFFLKSSELYVNPGAHDTGESKHIDKVKTQNGEGANLSLDLCSLAFGKWLSLDRREVV